MFLSWMKMKWILIVLMAGGVGLIMILQSWNQEDNPGTKVFYEGDPLGQLGKSWNPEQIRQITTKGRSFFKINKHISHTIRMDDFTDVDMISPGEMGQAGGRTLDISQGSMEYPSDSSPLCEKSRCLVWRFQGLDLAKDLDFGGIEVHVNDRRREEHKFHVSFLSRTATIPLVPQQSMKYIILPDMTARLDNDGYLNTNSLVLVFPDLKRQDDLDLVSVKIVSKTAAYRDAHLGKTYEILDQETRPVVYQWTDGEVAWNVDVPGSNPVLKFGIGLLPNSLPVTFSVTVESKGKKKKLFKKKIRKTNIWTDNFINLSAWGKSSVRIIFKAESKSSAVALWSSPRIVEANRRGRIFCIYLVDALRPDFCEGFSTFRGRNNSTPAIRNLAEGGVRFNNMLANAPLTKYSMPTLFTGLYPSHTGVITYQKVPDSILTLAEAFRHNGFMTASFLFNGNAGRLRGLHQGFDYLFSMNRLAREARRLAEKKPDGSIYVENPTLTSGGMINDFLFDFIRTYQEEDIFLYIHLMDTHAPYFPDEEFLDGFQHLISQKGLEVPVNRATLLKKLKAWNRLLPKDRMSEDALLELYREAAETADKYLQRFMDFLQAEDMEERTTIVFTADHGEHLNEHPDICLFSHTYPMLLEVLRVPLIIHLPGIVPSGRIVSEPAQLADVMPTLLDLAGITYDPSQFDGVSLLLLMAGQQHEFFEARPIVSQYGPFWSLFLNNIHSPDITRNNNVLLYNVDRDPREHVALLGEDAEKNLGFLAKSLSMLTIREVAKVETIINEEETLEQLRQLGYIQ